MQNFLSRSARWVRGKYVPILIFGVFVLAANLFLYQFYHQEKFVYFWDWSFYESRYAFLVDRFHIGMVSGIRAVLHSIAYTEQSLLAPLFLVPWGLILGPSRTVFLFSILNAFALPAAAAVGAVFMRLVSLHGERSWSYGLIPAIILLLAPQFWIPITLGFYDVSTVVVVCLLWLILLSDRARRPVLKAVAAGVLLTTLIFIRRWFGYWVAAFFPAMFLEWLASRIRHRSPFWRLRDILVCGMSALVLFAVLAAPLMREILHNNYAVMFQAFKSGESTWRVIVEAGMHYGWLSLLFAAAGFIWALRDRRTRAFAGIVGAQTVMALILFARVQRIDQHHHYQFLIVIVLFQALFLYYLLKSRLHGSWKIIVSVLFFVVASLNFLQGLVRQFPVQVQAAHFMAGARHYPLQRHDTEEIRNLMKFLDTDTPPGARIYVVASSFILNEDVLRFSCLYLSMPGNVCARVMQSSHVDLRDGFPSQFFQADYVVVGDPVQYHLRPVDQQVVGILTRHILSHTGIGAGYEGLDQTFMLDSQVRLRIFRKVRPPVAEELEALKEEFEQAYPGREDLFEQRILHQVE